MRLRARRSGGAADVAERARPSYRSRRESGSTSARGMRTRVASQALYPHRNTVLFRAAIIGRVPILELTKYQALSNDYLVLDLPADLDRVVSMLPRLCDRHLGLGADGLLAFDPSELFVRIFNPDGSEAEKSGNGLRIAACHAVLRHGADTAFEISTIAQANPIRIVEVSVSRVVSELEIGIPTLEPDRWVFIDTAAGRARCRLANVGNPHCVVFGEPVTRARCVELGPLLERNELFPNRTNVQLAEVVD